MFLALKMKNMMVTRQKNGCLCKFYRFHKTLEHFRTLFIEKSLQKAPDSQNPALAQRRYFLALFIKKVMMNRFTGKNAFVLVKYDFRVFDWNHVRSAVEEVI